MRSWLLGCLAGTGFLALVGCESRGPSGEWSVRDSAGVEIVEAGRLAVDPLTVAGEPLLEIGRVEGDPAYLFMRPVDAVLLESGVVVVLDAGVGEVRWFDHTGRHVRTVGRSGEGPGEFVRPQTLLRLRGDSLAVFDEAQQRMTLFDSAGSFIRTWQVEPPPGAAAEELEYFRPPPFGRLEDGRFLHRTSRRALRTGHVRKTAVILAFSSAGKWLGPIVAYPGGDWLVERIEGGVRSTTGLGDRRAAAATDGEVVYGGNGDTYEISVYDSTGHLKGVIRRQVPPTPADEEQIEVALESLRQRIANLPASERPQAERALGARADEMKSQLARHTTMPTYYAMETDEASRLWIRTGRDPNYDVVDQEGRFLGSVRLPGEPLYLGTNEVLVRRDDELDVPSVAVYQVRRPSAK